MKIWILTALVPLCAIPLYTISRDSFTEPVPDLYVIESRRHHVMTIITPDPFSPDQGITRAWRAEIHVRENTHSTVHEVSFHSATISRHTVRFARVPHGLEVHIREPCALNSSLLPRQREILCWRFQTDHTNDQTIPATTQWATR